MHVRHVGFSLLAVAGVAAACSGSGDDGPAPALEELTFVAYESQTSGAIKVESTSPTPGDWFQVLLAGEQVGSGNPPLLGVSVEVPPGTYEVAVNRTRRTVTVQAGQQAILRTGDLLVEGSPEGAIWYPMQDGDQKVSSNPPILGGLRALFAGSYDVVVHGGVGVDPVSLGVAIVRPGQVTTVRR